MDTLEWRFAVPLAQPDILERFEQDYGIHIPQALKKTVAEHNAGIPSRGVFDVPRPGLVFAGLLSFNPGDEETVYQVLDPFLQGGKLQMLPFGSNGFGDLIAWRETGVVLWAHETETIEPIAESMEAFFALLHE